MDEAQLLQLPVPPPIREAVRAQSGEYEFEKFSDKGANGYLLFGRERVLRRRVAIKYYYWGGNRQYHAEPRRLIEIQCDHVATVFRADTVDNEWAYFVTPYYEAGDLDQLLSTRSPSLHEAIRFVEEVLVGVNHLHSRNLVHRDIKPANIFLDTDGRAVVGDFGSVRQLPDAAGTVPGSGTSILFCPPETCSNQTYSTRGDIYQAGLLLFRLLGGYMPYDGLAWLTGPQRRALDRIADSFERNRFVDDALRQKIVRGRLASLDTLYPWVPRKAKRLLRRALNTDINRRVPDTTSFIAGLQELRRTAPDWRVTGADYLMELGATRRRVVESEPGLYQVLRPRGTGWQRDNTHSRDTLPRVCESLNNAYG